MVCGEIGEKALTGCEAVVPAEAVAPPLTSNALAGGWPDEGDFWDASDCRASMTDDAAPRASNMIKLRTC
jgi:hypothetical protein